MARKTNQRRRLAIVIAAAMVCATVAGDRTVASTFTVTSPTIAGQMPDNVTPVGGIVFDFIGFNNRRLYSQMAASSLFNGFFVASPGTIGTQTGWTAPLVNALGGGLNQVAVRITLFDGDNAAGEFDFNQNGLVVSGVSFGNWSAVIAENTDNTGNTAAGGLSAGGFRNNLLDTGWFLLTDPVALAALHDALEADGQLIVQLTDVDPGDNALNFQQGVDIGLAGGGAAPNVSVTLADIARTQRQRRVGRALDTLRGSGGDLGDAIDLIDLLPFDADVRAALDNVTNRLDHMPADSMIHAMTAQGWHVNSRLSALHRGEATGGFDAGGLTASSLASAVPPSRSVAELAASIAPFDPLAPAMAVAVDAADPALAADPIEAPIVDMHRLGVFAVGALSYGGFERTDNQLPGDFDAASVTLGVDYAVTESLRLGVALGYGDHDADFDDDSRFDAASYAVTLFGTWAIDDGLFVDFMGAYAFSDVELRRRVAFFGVDRFADGDTHTGAFSGAARLVKQFDIGPVTIAPEAQVRYIHVDVDGYSEKGAGGLSLIVDDNDADSLIASLGAYASVTQRVGSLELTPYGGASWEYEFEHDTRRITHAFAGAPGTPFDSPTDDPDRSVVNLSAGLTVRFCESAGFYADYTTVLDNRLLDNQTIRFGLRLSF